MTKNQDSSHDRLALGELVSREDHMPILMGILNVTPDSFSDGGQFENPQSAVSHAEELVEQGAHVVDIGAESTRPGFQPASLDQEWRRLEPIIPELVGRGMIVSVDTTKAEIARRSLSMGARIINDIWGFQSDPDMPFVVADSNAYVVLMHNRQEVDERLDILSDWQRFFDFSLNIAEKAQVPQERLILDPGIGFAKTPQQNLQAIRFFNFLKSEYHLPVLLGLSRKSLFNHFLGREVHERLAATLAADLFGANAGADILRIHDVQEHADAFRIQHLLKGNVQ